MAKTEGTWSARTLAEWAASKAVVWRAQISTSPDGKEFAGIRKYIIKADGTEIADRSGISMLYDGGSIGETVDELIKLLQTLKGGTVKVKASTGGKYGVVNDKGLFINDHHLGTEPKTALRFADEAKALAHIKAKKLKNMVVEVVGRHYAFTREKDGERTYLNASRIVEGKTRVKATPDGKHALQFDTRVAAGLYKTDMELPPAWKLARLEK